MWFFKLKDFFVPSDEEIELMVNELRKISDKKSTENKCCGPRHEPEDTATVGE